MEQGKLDEILKEMDENSKKRHVTGIGLTSIHELMKARYGPDYGLYIESSFPCSIPTPLSCTVTHTRSPYCSAVTQMVP